MSGSRALYEQVILDHNKTPRNFKKIEEPDYKIEGFNPLCGDHFTIYLKMDGDRIGQLTFEGAGCAISKSSASVMTTILQGKTIKEAKRIFDSFHAMVTSEPDAPLDESLQKKLRIFSGVREYPVRIKCATLAWHAMLSALTGSETAVSTE